MILRPARPRPTRRRVGAAVLGATAVVLVLAGCGSPQLAGSAAVIGDARISEDSLGTAIESVQNAAGEELNLPDGTTLPRAVLLQWVADELIDVAAEREGITATGTQISTVIDGITTQFAPTPPEVAAAINGGIPPEWLQNYARRQVLIQGLSAKLGEDKIGPYLSALSVELQTRVSPRFGAWDASSINVVAPADDLSQPAASFSGTPTPTPAPSDSATP